MQKLHKGETLGYLELRSKDGSLTHLQLLVPLNKSKDQYTLYGHTAFMNALAQQSLAEETDNKQKTNRLEIRQRLFRVKKVDMKPNQDPYPWLDKEDPHRFRTNDELIQSKIDLSDSVLNTDERNEIIDMLKQNRDAFSLRDEIGMCPYFEVKLQLRDDTPFFVQAYPIREEQKAIVQREMDRLEKLGIIEKGLTGYSSPGLLVKRKQQNLHRVVTDFRVLNERLIRINHVFPLVWDCLDTIGNSTCEVFTVIDLGDTYHMLRLAKESQKYCGIMPYYGTATYHYLRMGMGMSCSPGIWGQFADFILQK